MEVKNTNENNTISDKSEIAKREEAVLKFWQENGIFEKTLDQTQKGSEYIFYDGPPFATGTPHYGHIVAGTIKDAIPRYQTMRGRFVRRRWGWDCHGLPAENLVEKDLGLKSKKDIEEYGIANFNAKAREMVQEYVADWKVIVPRLGRFVDMENDYRTMDSTYSESVMQIFKRLHDKGLIYEGYKSMQICPRCETTLANFEVNLGYRDITDISVTVKFELVDPVRDDGASPVSNGAGEPKTFVLAWTTTPWTLPGNVALAVNPEITYVKVKIQGADQPGIFIAAQERIAQVFDGKDYEVIGEMKGSDLIGRSYKPAFDYYVNDEAIKNRENGWKIYGADFVTTEDGTGVVHIAPAFGEDDMKLGQKEKLPFVQHVSMDGRFKPEVKDWAGELVKPKSAPGLDDADPTDEEEQAMDVKILKNLASKGILFSKLKILHAYPHCWRCGTPLLNYATSSWFVEVTKFKDQLVANNKTIGWVPEHVKEGRFGNWLEGARDWAISRSRYWGAPIPVWKCAECKKVKVIGGVAEIKDNTAKSGNKYLIMRHGQTEPNVLKVCSNNHYPLTEEGRKQVEVSAEKLVGEKIDLIVASDYIRTKETAEIVAEKIGIDSANVIFDERLREINVGEFDKKPIVDYTAFFSDELDRMSKRPEGGENLADVKTRTGEFIYDLDKKYQNKKILLVAHSDSLWMLWAAANGLNDKEVVSKNDEFVELETAETRPLEFSPLPHNEKYELDLHRPYIDEVKFACECGGEMKRIPDVFDCWFESGSMPYAQSHYPFENANKFDPEKNIGFPADFIAEGLDQTRGWFYSMLVLSTALFGKTSYKNVIVNGMVLAEDGQKMSKSLKNYPDPMAIVDKFGADALRFYLMSSPVMRAEDLNFTEKGVGEIYRKIIMRLSNVYSFYEMYAPKEEIEAKGVSANVLDLWINARFAELVTKVTEAMERYELDRAMRPIDEFIDDMSNWYLRRSRDRFKSEDVQDKKWAIVTTKTILNNLAKVMAPFTPFVAEEIYQKTGGEKESVHLESWPVKKRFDSLVIEKMVKTRELVEMGLALRDRKGLKVRQPVSELIISTEIKLEEGFLRIIADEINAKSVVGGDLDKLPSDHYEIYLNELDQKPLCALNFELTDDLRAEGEMRELVRNIQELRKKEGLMPGDVVSLKITTDDNGKILVNKFADDIKRLTGAKEINIELGAGDIKIGNSSFVLSIVK